MRVCQTPGCVNNGIEFDMPDEAVVVCGPCGEPLAVGAAKPKRRR